MTKRPAAVIVGALAVVATHDVEAQPARGVQVAARRFPAFGALVAHIGDAQVDVIECDTFAGPSLACDDAARDLSSASALLVRPARAPDTTWRCTTAVAWLGPAVTDEGFVCEYAAPYVEARVEFACARSAPDQDRRCTLDTTNANEDESRHRRWTFTVTGSRRAPVLGPVLFEYAEHN